MEKQNTFIPQMFIISTLKRTVLKYNQCTVKHAVGVWVGFRTQVVMMFHSVSDLVF